MNLSEFHDLFFEALKRHAAGIRKWIPAKHRHAALVAAVWSSGVQEPLGVAANNLAAQIASQLDSEIHSNDATVCYHVEELSATLDGDGQHTNITVKLFIGEVR